MFPRPPAYTTAMHHRSKVVKGQRFLENSQTIPRVNTRKIPRNSHCIPESMDQAALAEIGVESPVAEEVARLASLAYGSGADGIVCSPQEAAEMRELLGPDALIVTPGVRPAGSEVGDQKRIATPAAAIEAGASKLVIGRPITGADDPVAAFDAICEELMA